MTTSLSLAEYADALLGGHQPEQLQWLTRRLRGDRPPRLPGYKAGRQWRATPADVQAAIELLRPNPVAMPVIPERTGMTKTSMKRIAS